MKYEDRLMDPEVRRLYYERLRAMPGSQKVRLMSDMHEQARRMVRASIRNHNPNWTEEQVEAEARRRFRAWCN